jgi:hypothetical protein
MKVSGQLQDKPIHFVNTKQFNFKLKDWGLQIQWTHHSL